MDKLNKTTRFVATLILSTLVTTFTSQAAQTEFSADISYEGACEVSSPVAIIFNNGDDILPSDIEAANAVTKKTFNLTLSKCQGRGVTPKITLIGESHSDSGEKLFLDATSSSATGYGIRLKNDATTVFKENTNLAVLTSILANDDWDKSTNLDTINGDIPMEATLTCGKCETDGRQGGELNASVTFEFQYD